MIDSNLRRRPLCKGHEPDLHRAVTRFALLSALALASSTSNAQAGVTLYGGARAGGEFVDQNHGDSSIKLSSGAAGALSFDWILADGRQAQVFYSFQRSGLPGSALNTTGEVPVNISYLQAGGRVFFDGSYAMNGAYLVGGLGITHFAPDLGGLSSEVRPSMNLGFGHQWILSKQMALRAELRGYFTLINSGGGFFCNGGCTVAIRGDTLTQFEGLLGLTFGL